MIGFDKAVKLLLGNYIITGIVFAMGFALEWLIIYLWSHDVNILWFDSSSLTNLITNAKLTLLLASYALWMFFRYKHSTINIQIPDDDVKRKGIMVLIVPLCVLGIILSLSIILLGNHIFDITWLENVIPNNTQIQNIVFNIPTWIMIHGIIVFILSLNIKFSKKVIGNEFGETHYE